LLPCQCKHHGSRWFCYSLLPYQRLEGKPHFKEARMSCPKGHTSTLTLGFTTEGFVAVGLAQIHGGEQCLYTRRPASREGIKVMNCL
jgi:hypothetical protein